MPNAPVVSNTLGLGRRVGDRGRDGGGTLELGTRLMEDETPIPFKSHIPLES